MVVVVGGGSGGPCDFWSEKTSWEEKRANCATRTIIMVIEERVVG